MKLKRIILGCFISFFGIMMVDAASVEIDGVSSIKTNETQKYELSLSNVGSDVFNQVEFSIEYDSNLLKLTEGSGDEYGTSEKYSGNSVIILNADKFSDGAIGSFSFTSLSGDYTTTSFMIKNIVLKNNGAEVARVSDCQKSLTLKQGNTVTTKALNTSAKVTSINFKNSTMKPAFSSDVKDYKLFVKDTIRQVTINYTTEQSGVTLKSECTLGCSVSESTDNIIQIVQGKNEVTFTFTSEDGKNSETYNFIIYRGETTDGSNKLSSLKVKDFDINEEFNEDILDYTLSIPFEMENIEVEAIGADSEATIKIKGNENLKVGENIVTITVIPTDSENDINIYNITVLREEFVPDEPTTSVINDSLGNKNNSNIVLIILIALGGLTIIGVAAYFIFFYKGKKKNEDVELNEEEVNKEDSKTNIEDTFVNNSIEDALDDLMKTKDIFNDKE